MLSDVQTLRQVFYPKNHRDVKFNKKTKHFAPKQEGEIRVISCDIAFVEGKKNDNSIYSCIRGIPETMRYETDDSEVEVKQGYKRQYSYIESNQLVIRQNKQYELGNYMKTTMPITLYLTVVTGVNLLPSSIEI